MNNLNAWICQWELHTWLKFDKISTKFYIVNTNSVLQSNTRSWRPSEHKSPSSRFRRKHHRWWDHNNMSSKQRIKKNCNIAILVMQHSFMLYKLLYTVRWWKAVDDGCKMVSHYSSSHCVPWKVGALIKLACLLSSVQAAWIPINTVMLQ